jgi:hypothetical protein
MEGITMRAYTIAIAIVPWLVFANFARAQDRTFGDFDCTEDCSGHAAGYSWAEKHSIDDESDCPQGNSQSFHEGCIAYSRDPSRGADEDDDGNMTGQPVRHPMDSDDDDDDDK